VLEERQIGSLDRVIERLEAGEDIEAARQTNSELVHNVLEAFLKALADQSVMKGIFAAAAISATSIAVVEIGPISQALIARSIVGAEVVRALRSISNNPNDEDEWSLRP